jgi:hypothetical protein
MRTFAHIVTLLLLLAGGPSIAQQEVYKVSKLLSKNYSKEVIAINISGEKASIELEGWESDFIEVRIRMISRNPIKKSAENDIQYIKTDLQQVGSTLRIRNYFDGKSAQITSNLSLEYTIKVPSGVSVSVKDLYGKVSLKQLTNQIQTDISFGSLEMESLNGTINITGKYSTIEGNTIGGSFTCTAEKTDINLKGVNGSVAIESKYGEIGLSFFSNQYPVTINSQRTKILIALPDKLYNYKLKTLFSEISLPGIEVIKDDFYEKFIDEKVGTLDITTSYCPIIITKEKSLK